MIVEINEPEAATLRHCTPVGRHQPGQCSMRMRARVVAQVQHTRPANRAMVVVDAESAGGGDGGCEKLQRYPFHE